MSPEKMLKRVIAHELSQRQEIEPSWTKVHDSHWHGTFKDRAADVVRVYGNRWAWWPEGWPQTHTARAGSAMCCAIARKAAQEWLTQAPQA